MISAARKPRVLHVSTADATAAASRTRDEFLTCLEKSDQTSAVVALHMAQCGAPFAIDEHRLGDIYNLDTAIRLVAINALLVQTPRSPSAIRLMMSFVADARRTNSSSLDAWRRYLVVRCLDVIREDPPCPVDFVEFVLGCLSGSVDEREFALSALWRMGEIDASASDYCVAAAESDDLDRRWGAVLALASARYHVDDRMLKSLLAQFYDREHRVQGLSLRDVAAYSLMRLAAVLPEATVAH